MGWINEYTPLFPHSAKQPDLDYYLFLSVGFIIVAFMTIKETKDNGILNRNQTEEWKGWMQMQFLMYHYLHQVYLPAVMSSADAAMCRRRHTTQSACTFRATCG